MDTPSSLPESGRSEEHYLAKLPAVTLEVICNKHVREGLTMTPALSCKAAAQTQDMAWEGR